MGPKCVFFRKCYYYRARKQWDEADIVVANHALFFTDLAMRSEGDTTGLLPNYGVVLIDEAHTLEDHAADHLGLHLAEYALIGTLNRLFNPDNAKGILMRGGSSYLELRKMIADLRAEAYRFFGTYSDYLDEQRESALTITNPARFPERLSPKLFDAVQLMDEISEDEADESFKTEFCSLMNRLRDFGDMIVEFTCQNRPDTVYYAERDRNQLILNGSPLRVDQLLNRHLFRQDFPVILCSATLTVRNTFDYYFGRIGFCNGTNLKLDSPFSPDQAKIYIPRYFPEPSDPAFPQALVESLPQYIELTDDKAFVLFTSYQTMRYCADKLRHTFEARGWKLLVQGIDGQRSQILSDFRNDVNSVLFGTDSFWTGVDVPGEALSNVIVTKLPFAVPSHPLIAARMREIERDGKSSFSEYSLPEAVLKFRQGAGRLIRSRQDTGVIVVLDHRVVSKGYGRLFLDALPYQVVLE